MVDWGSNDCVTPPAELQRCVLAQGTVFTAYYRFNPGRQEIVSKCLKNIDWDVKHQIEQAKHKQKTTKMTLHCLYIICLCWRPTGDKTIT